MPKAGKKMKQAQKGKIVIKTVVTNKKARARARRGGRKRPGPGGRGNPYAQVVLDPFGSPPCKIPDSLGDGTGVATARHTGTTGTGTVTNPQSTFDYLITMSPFMGTVNMSVWVRDAAIATPVWVMQSQMIYSQRTSLFGASSQYSIASRLVAMGMKITPTAGELYTGGRVHVIQHNARVSATQSDPASFGPMVSTSDTVGAILNSAVVRHSARLGDSSVTAHWIPSAWSMAYTDLTTSTTSAINVSNFIPAPIGYQTFSFLLEGVPADSGTASTTPPLFEIDCISHFEVRPLGQYTVIYSLTPTCADPVMFAEAVNLLSRAAQARASSEEFSGGTTVGSGAPSNGFFSSLFGGFANSGFSENAGALAGQAAGALGNRAMAMALHRLYNARRPLAIRG